MHAGEVGSSLLYQHAGVNSATNTASLNTGIKMELRQNVRVAAHDNARHYRTTARPDTRACTNGTAKTGRRRRGGGGGEGGG